MMQTRGIVAFKIEITEIQATKKLSQNAMTKNNKTSFKIRKQEKINPLHRK
jgi:transcriptional regulator